MTHLVLLHGALGVSSQLTALSDALAPYFHMHRLDFEGHATARDRGRPFRVAHFVQNVLDLLDDKGIERASFFGYSMGGYVALALALEHPTRVAKVATLGTKFRWDPDTAAREATRLDPATIRAKVPRFADTLEARHQTAGGWELVLGRTADFLRDLGAHPTLTDETLGAITHPVRVIVGDRDNTVSVEESTAVSHALGAGSLTVLPNTTHPIEQVDVGSLASVLIDFFQ
jgi:pimeloyl-ACP methyl ester carboxylesterase